MDHAVSRRHPALLRNPLTAVFLTAAVVLGVLYVGFGSPARAVTPSNFIATGHDMDLHCSGGDLDECAYFDIVVTIVRNGSTLPILALDEGTQVPEALAAIGEGPVTTVDPSDTATFNATPFTGPGGAPLYSAIIVASDETCGGCDNSATSIANINARSADFRAFFNEGGGILALAGSDRRDTYYDFVPLPGLTAAAVSAPFTVTPEGAARGITSDMANCCPTHNSFELPPSPFVVFETDSEGRAETIAALNVIIDGGGFVTTTTTSTTVVVPGSITLAPATDVNMVGTEHTVTATVFNDAGGPQAGTTVTFTVTSGPNAGETGTDVTDAAGQATFTWTGDGGAGEDTVTASFVATGGETRTATATKDWATSVPIPVVPAEGIPVALAVALGAIMLWRRRQRRSAAA